MINLKLKITKKSCWSQDTHKSLMVKSKLRNFWVMRVAVHLLKDRKWTHLLCSLKEKSKIIPKLVVCDRSQAKSTHLWESKSNKKQPSDKAKIYHQVSVQVKKLINLVRSGFPLLSSLWLLTINKSINRMTWLETRWWIKVKKLVRIRSLTDEESNSAPMNSENPSLDQTRSTLLLKK